ncbi:phage baseplate assembly protein domain-containing protein [Aliivibrio fischeri]|uniref:phage baseplate assembly protein domain-containing protein n=1 Tax=Aliivibrio fischeri TaxID=668 RepID=UPI0012D9F147|nr:phage baseplate assembly protein [Aliivibrio fischeri]MUJ21346.1 phage baseplate protein [Aliivibrio fischeri]
MFNRLMSRIKNMVAIGSVTGANTKVLQIKTSTSKTNDRIKRLHNYGFVSRPKVGSRAYLLFLGGVMSRGFSFCVEDERYEMELEEGEVAMMDDKGNVVHFTKNGISITSLGAVEVNAQKDVTLKADGKAIVTAQLIELNGAEGGVVRDCDGCAFSGAPHAVASKKVKAG